ncbi:hypothetical protein NPS53_08280 [Pseudomonas putida]|uniref:hypothetical protein n=1 Tax=Pseudomonas putida TaxID=303 RepID=UPI002363C9B3|nr:hypothetical protein [Pseudomonas putida]MDD2139568.1 hypothetical protein [Pseudomonas putida]HDS1721491.1 hypothetical protein [Pseudomonas putida]
MSNDQSTITTAAIRQSRRRVVVAVVGFAAIFGLSIVALTSMLPSPAGSYLKMLFIVGMAILATGANVYYQHCSEGWRDVAGWIVLAVIPSTLFLVIQFSVNAEVAPIENFAAMDLLVTFALMLAVASISSLLVRKTILGSFKLRGASGPKFF